MLEQHPGAKNGVPAARPRLIAYYLPQFHPIPENDAWWGKGFTEWTNVMRARPLFPGHYQPHLPADLGFYDLRLPEAREAQAELARQYGIHGFCYYHYWFEGRRLLERPVADILQSGKPDFPFCLCWANENWTRIWDGRDREILLRQTYSSEDDIQHIRYLASVFRDPRYIRVHGKPLFLVYRAANLPNALETTTTWRREAQRQGIGDLYLCRIEVFGLEPGTPGNCGFDAAVEWQPDYPYYGNPILPPLPFWSRVSRRLRRFFKPIPYKSYDYAYIVEVMKAKPPVNYRRFPAVALGWDNTARRGAAATLLYNSTPEVYREWLAHAIRQTSSWQEDEQMVFINAWNEWAEGTHLEPDLRYGRSYLEATRQAWLGADSRGYSMTAIQT